MVAKDFFEVRKRLSQENKLGLFIEILLGGKSDVSHTVTVELVRRNQCLQIFAITASRFY